MAQHDTWTGRTLGEPTAEQWAALRAYAAAHGRTWKAQLRAEWMDACQGIPDLEQQALLQQVRNQFGPRWLMLIDIEAER
jgi:hypothetical protein